MGIPKKGSRRIEVGGKFYRYLIKETHIDGHKDQKELSVTIQENVDKPGNVLQFRAGYGVAILKPDIALNIRSALKTGWNPNARGAAVVKKWQWANVKYRPPVKTNDCPMPGSGCCK